MIDDLQRLPPQDLEAEAAVLASCIIDGTMAAEACELLTAEDFYRGGHQRIFRAIKAARRAGPVDLLTVRAALADAQDLEAAGGAAYLSRLTDTSAVAVHAEAYCRRIKDKATLRRLLERAQRIAQRCHRGGDAAEILDASQREILELDTGAGAAWCTMERLSHETLDGIEQARRGTDAEVIPTGLPTLDALTGGGLRGALLVVLAARPRIGKTALACTMARNIAEAGGKAVGVFSLEMPRKELDLRWLAMLTKINAAALRAGFYLRGNRRVPFGPEDWEKIARGSEEKARWRIFMDDTASLTAGELRRRARRMVKAGARILFVDQLSKIRGGQGRGLYEQTTSVVNDLADLKKELGVPVVLLAQVRRPAEGKEREPGLADLKSTGSLEEDADMVLFIHRDTEDQAGRAMLHLAKNRGGPERRIPLTFDAGRTLFTEPSGQV